MIITETKEKQKRGKIDNIILFRAIGEGKTKLEAGKLAGSLAKHDSTVVNQISKIINNPNNSEHKKGAVEQMEAKRQMMLDAMTTDSITGQSLAQLSTSIGIFTDKIELLSGRETERVGIKPIIISETPIKGDVITERATESKEL